MMGHCVLHRGSGNEHLVAPEHRQPTCPALCIASGLLDDPLQDGDGHHLVVDEDCCGDLHAGFIVVLRTRQGR